MSELTWDVQDYVDILDWRDIAHIEQGVFLYVERPNFVALELNFIPEGVFLRSIWTETPGVGLGGRAMEKLIRASDAAKVDLFCHPRPFVGFFDEDQQVDVVRENCPDKDGLTQWYLKLGFTEEAILFEDRTVCMMRPHGKH